MCLVGEGTCLGLVFSSVSLFNLSFLGGESRHVVVLASSPIGSVAMGLQCGTWLNARRCQWGDGAAAGWGLRFTGFLLKI